MSKIFTIADVPPELHQQWLQHLRDFDAAHPSCRFQVMADLPAKTFAEIVDTMRLNPNLTFAAILDRKP